MNELIAIMNSYGNHMQQTAVARVTAISAMLTSVTTTATTATMSFNPTTTTVITTSNATPPPPPPPTTTTTTNSDSATGPTGSGPASQHSLQQHQDHQQLRQSIDCLVADKFGVESVYVSELWLLVRQTCPEDRKYDLIQITEVLSEDDECYSKLSERKCGVLLSHLKHFPLDFLKNISILIYPHLYEPAPSFIHDYDGLKRVPEGYLNYVPAEADGLEPFESSGFGNCLWCSLSIILEGDEHCQNQLRLGAVIETLCRLTAFTKQIAMELNDSDSALQWASTVASSDRVIRSLQGLQSPTDIVRGVIEEEIKETLHNFTDSGLFQLMMAAEFLQREIRQFCRKAGADHYNGPIAPMQLRGDDNSTVGKPLNILWVPATIGEDRFNHILPLLPWRCGCVKNDLCLFGLGLNQDVKWDEARKEMVQCPLCDEWYHCSCLGVTLRQFRRSNLDCGCQVLPNNTRRVKSKDRAVYSNIKTIQSLVLTKTNMKNLARNLYGARKLSLRNALFLNPGKLAQQRQHFRKLAMGPLEANVVDQLFDYGKKILSECALSFSGPLKFNQFLSDVLLPEAMLQVIMKVEGLNYYRAHIFYEKV